MLSALNDLFTFSLAYFFTTCVHIQKQVVNLPLHTHA